MTKKFFITTKVIIDRMIIQDIDGMRDMNKATDYIWNGETNCEVVQLHLLRDEFITDKIVYNDLFENKFNPEVDDMNNDIFIEVNPLFQFGVIEPHKFHIDYLGLPKIIPLQKQTINEESTEWHVHINHPVSIAFQIDPLGMKVMGRKKFKLKFYQDYYQMSYSTKYISKTENR